MLRKRGDDGAFRLWTGLFALLVAVLVLALTIFRLSYTYFFTDPSVTNVPQPTVAQVITLCIVLPVFYFTYTYFVISDYLAGLYAFGGILLALEQHPRHSQMGREIVRVDLQRVAEGRLRLVRPFHVQQP